MREERESSSRRAALVFNPTKATADQVRAAAVRLSAEAGWETPLLLETTIDDPGQGVTAAALAAGVSAVMVAGGDGTVRAVAEAMRGSGVPLTIVPSGTGNLLARNLGLPLDNPERMITATFSGTTTSIDIGIADVERSDGTRSEHAFVVMAGIGMDAAMIANTRPKLKKQIGWMAYLDGAARSLPLAKPFRVMYELADNRLHTARVQSIVFANCGKLPGGISLIPGASIADGVLDIAMFQPKGKLGWLAVWRTVWWDNSVLRRYRTGRLMLERRGPDRAVRYHRGEWMEAATHPARPIELDGDEFGDAVRLRCSVDPAGLLTVVPSDHDLARI